MLSEREVSAAIGAPVHGADGDKIGTVEHFFVDDRTGAPTWVAVSTGLFGTRHSVVPAADASFADGRLQVPVSKDAVKAAPHVPDTGRLDPATEGELRRHYGLGPGTGPGADLGAGPDVGAPPAPPEEAGGRHAAPGGGTDWSPTQTSAVPVGAVHAGDEPPGPVAVPEHEVAAARGDVPDDTARDTTARDATARDATGRDATGRDATAPDGGMVRSEEQLRVATERVADRRVRLVKYVVTEEVQVTVPIRREEVRLEEVPLGAADDDAAGGPGSVAGESLVPPGAEAGHGPAAGTGLPGEIVLHAERPVVSVEVVPVERVRLRTEQVPGEERITDRLQREQIEVDRS